ncbi:MAG TPA: hypothetical protein VMG12_19295 [Polyangiaceae bacterium]|nr:hypothetical protein [Polyangiaceae bacterium]
MISPSRWTESTAAFFERPLQRLRLGYAAWLFGMFCYFLPAATWSPVSRFNVTRAIVEQGTLSIDSFADSTGDRALHDGHWYSDKAPLPALLALPAYQAYHLLDRARGKAPAYEARGTAERPAARLTVNRSFQRGLYVCSLSTVALSGVALGLILFELLRRRVSTSQALWGSAATLLCTCIFPYSTGFYGHVMAGTFLTAAAWLLDPHERANGSAPPTWGRAAGAGACLTAAVGCEYLAAVPALVLGLALLAYHRRDTWLRWLLGMALGALGPAAIIGAYHAVCFGAPWRTGYSFIVNARFAAGHASGFLGIRWPRPEALAGLLFGRFRGLFYVAPVTLLLLVGVLARARQKDAAALAAALAFLALLLVNASYYMWWGGAAAGPRHLVPVLGLLALGLPWVLEYRWARWALFALGAVSAANMLVIAGVGLEAPERGDVLFDFAYARLLQGRLSAIAGASNLGLEFGIVRGGTLGPLLVWMLGGAHILSRQMHELLGAPRLAQT